MKALLITSLLVLSSTTFASSLGIDQDAQITTSTIDKELVKNLELTIKYANAPKAGKYTVNITNENANVYRSFDFGKRIINSKTIVEYKIYNNTDAKLDFISGIRTKRNHIKGDHTCSVGIEPGKFCTLWFYYNPTKWGNHDGKGIIQFTQDKSFTVYGKGKARRN